MTQVFEKAKLVNSVQPGVQLAASVTVVSTTAIRAHAVVNVTLAEASTSAKDASAEEEDASFHILALEGLAEVWDNDVDAAYDKFLEDADLQ